MRIKQRMTRFLMNRLSLDEQIRLAGDLIAWRFADLPPAEQQAKIEQLGPGLMGMMRQGRVGLLLLITHHLLRLPPLRWCRLSSSLSFRTPTQTSSRNGAGRDLERESSRPFGISRT
jgi:hypothetical protein